MYKHLPNTLLTLSMNCKKKNIYNNTIICIMYSMLLHILCIVQWVII